jgi:peptide/nickel transport system substrate-binding protein
MSLSNRGTMMGRRAPKPKLVIMLSLLALGMSFVCHSAVVSAQEQPLYGGTMVLATFADPGSLNPGLTTSVPTHIVTGPIFNGLVSHDFAFGAVPDLAERWSVSPDGRVYTFHLAKHALWHDGQPVTSADVKFTFEEVLLKYHGRTRAALEKNLEAVETSDPHTVAFRFREPYAPFLALIDVVNAPILPRHVYAGYDIQKHPANSAPVGSGPFKFKEWVRGDHITLVRNDRYFKAGKPYLDRVVIRIMPDPAAATIAFEKGEVDYFLFPPPHELARLRQLPGVVVTTRGREGFAGIVTLIPNLRRPVLSNPNVRQAMAYAIDREVMLDTVYFDTGEVATGPISRALDWAYNPGEPRYTRDVAKANTLLDEAGYPRGTSGVRFPLSIVYDTAFAKLAEVLRDQFGEVGIDLQLKLMERNAWIDAVYKRWEFDLAFTHFENGPDPDIGVKRVYVSSNVVPIPFSNAAGYQNPRVDELFDLAAKELDRATRARAYFEIQDILLRESPYLWLIESGHLSGVAFRAEFHGLHSWSSKSIMTYGDDAWWGKGKPGEK